MVDLGIIGENILEEEELGRLSGGENVQYKMLKRLEFGGCRLSIAVRDMQYNGVQDLADARIATSYPHLLKRYMQEEGVPFKIVCSRVPLKLRRRRTCRCHLRFSVIRRYIRPTD